jgi:hypothetical protein
VRGWPGVTHKVQPGEPIRSLHAASRTQTNAPAGGGTTQRGDPAPGPMRCGTTASGEERMHQ